MSTIEPITTEMPAVTIPVSCKECSSIESLKPAIFTKYAPFFCISCCNYIDEEGNLKI